MRSEVRKRAERIAKAIEKISPQFYIEKNYRGEHDFAVADTGTIYFEVDVYRGDGVLESLYTVRVSDHSANEWRVMRSDILSAAPTPADYTDNEIIEIFRNEAQARELAPPPKRSKRKWRDVEYFERYFSETTTSPIWRNEVSESIEREYADVLAELRAGAEVVRCPATKFYCRLRTKRELR